jgi:N-acetylglucosamine kinase-like BadF-type ATPase
MSLARLYLGVDGGQSSTTALIADEEGSILGVGTSGPCNHVAVAEGAAKLKRVVLECLFQACERAGLDAESVLFTSVCFGMSGGPEDKKRLLSEIIRSSQLEVTDDAAIALSGALGGEPGVVTIAGTGSISFGRDGRGQRARAGGWGYVFGDEGGAFDVVRQALRASLRYEEGWGPPTKLREALLEHTGKKDANAVLHAFYTAEWPRSRVAALAPLVNSLAEARDEVAQAILEAAADRLASFALAVRGKLWSLGSPVRFSFIGGVFRSELLLNRFRSQIELQPGCQTALPMLGAAAGALLEAYHAAGVSPNLDKLLTSNF